MPARLCSGTSLGDRRGSYRAEMPVLCFAYGSNMLHTRLAAAERAPSARRVAVAELTQHRLRFDKRGADGSGKCNIEPAATGQRVYGVVYAMERAELASLDRAEGGYERVELEVRALGGEVLRAETYRALPPTLEPKLAPFDWYKAIVLAGARAARHPDSYLATLEAQPERRDPDASRRARHLALLDLKLAA